MYESSQNRIQTRQRRFRRTWASLLACCAAAAANIPKYHALAWIGIVGGAITVFANLKDVMNLADWTSRLIGYWQDWNHAIWVWVFDFIANGFEPSQSIVPMLSFAVFITSLVAGLNLSFSPEKRDQAMKRQKVILFLLGSVLYTGLTVGFAVAHDWLILLEQYLPQYMRDFDYLAVFLFPAVFLIFVMEEKALVVPASLLFFLCVTFLVVIPASGQGINNADYDEYDTLDDAVLMMLLIYFYQIGWMAVVLFTPLRPLVQCLSFLLMGVAILIAIGKISEFGPASGPQSEASTVAATIPHFPDFAIRSHRASSYSKQVNGFGAAAFMPLTGSG
jgi:hypothetical protein